MTWLNWSLKFHSRLRTISHLIHTQHTCLMFNECLIHLFDCTCLNVICVCLTIYRSIQKVFDHFIYSWKWFLSLFVFMFSAYFVFHCLNMFCVEKQVSESFTTHSRLVKIFATHLTTRENFHDSLNHETPRNNFLKGFSWETCFKPLSSSIKPLPSSLKPLFQYFYIKTQSIWMVFHSINISMVILNSFHWFGSLDYVLESLCALGWDFHHRGWGDLIFVKFLYGIGFFWCFSLDVGPLWQKEYVLRVDFMLFMHCFTLLFIMWTLGVW